MKTQLIPGSKHGKWTVIDFDKVDDRRRCRYFCRCECGTEKSVLASEVAAGRTKSCPRCKADDLTGRVFGKWKVLRRLNSDECVVRHHSMWLCECSCGDQHQVDRCNLIRGESKSCWRCSKGVIETTHFPKIWYRKQIEQAKLRGREWNVSEQQLWDLWLGQDGRCALTQLPLVFDKTCKLTTASLDRKDSSKGYFVENVWFVHKHINIMKYNFGLEYFMEMCALVSSCQMEGIGHVRK